MSQPPCRGTRWPHGRGTKTASDVNVVSHLQLCFRKHLPSTHGFYLATLQAANKPKKQKEKSFINGSLWTCVFEGSQRGPNGFRTPNSESLRIYLDCIKCHPCMRGHFPFCWISYTYLTQLAIHSFGLASVMVHWETGARPCIGNDQPVAPGAFQPHRDSSCG